MSQRPSPSTGKSYGLALACRVCEVARSTVYAHRARKEDSASPDRPGPKESVVPDEELIVRIRRVLATSPFHGEGHRKVWARLRMAGVRTSKRRVLRLMREHGLLAPTRMGTPRGPTVHDGTITTERPDEMWGIDATSATTVFEGRASIFLAVDHCTGECIGIHAAKYGTRFEALEPIRQGVQSSFGAYGPDVARGLAIRHDHGSQFISDVFQDELRLLGIESSPAFVRQPEGNGCVERFIRTLKEQLLWVESFRTVEELRCALMAFKERYNAEWIIGRHGYLTPLQARSQAIEEVRAAA